MNAALTEALDRAQELSLPDGDQLDLFHELASEQPTAAQVRLVESVASGLPSTTMALRALAEAMREWGDDDGAELCDRFARLMAAHEARVL